MQAKKKIRQSFSAAADSYDSVAVLQRKSGLALLKRIKAVPCNATVVDLGSGTGFLADELLRSNIIQPEQLLALDIALPMLIQARNKLANQQIALICADAENLPLRPGSVDLIISNLALQWCSHLEKVFSGVKQALKPGGRFLFTTFGPLTLHELKNAWKQVDGYTHVNEFVDAGILARLLANAGFNGPELNVQNHVSAYDSVWDLMMELKQLGAHTVLSQRKRTLTTKTSLERMADAYNRQGEKGLITATFEIITVIAEG